MAVVCMLLTRLTFARTVYTELDAWRAEQHGGREHGHGDGLAKSARRADEDLGLKVGPIVVLQDMLMLAREGACRFVFVERSSACFLYI